MSTKQMNNRYSKLFLDIAYYINDKEQIEKIVESRAFIKLFCHEDTYYDYYEEIYYILKIICKLNNIEILKKILYYADDYKYYEIQCDIGCFMAAELFMCNCDETAEIIIKEYYLMVDDVFSIMLKKSCKDKIKSIIVKNPTFNYYIDDIYDQIYNN